jgi:hypothetical protein
VPPCAGLFLGFRFGLGHDDHRLGGCARLLQAVALGRGENVARILQLAGGCHHMVGGHRELDVVVAEFQREFARTEELLVLPAVDVVVGRHAREPLGDLEQVVLVVELFVAGAAAEDLRLGDVVAPVDAEGHARARLQALRQVDAHHRLVDDVVQRAPAAILDGLDVEAAREGARLEGAADRVEFHAGFRRRAFPGVARRQDRGGARVRTRLVDVLVELDPQVSEGVRGIVVIRDRLGAADRALALVQRGADRIVGALLPVGLARRAGGGADRGRGREQFVELAEFVVERFRCKG